jgi:hypothetical protein
VNLFRGITGFWEMDDPPLPASDLKTFAEHCYSAARSLKGTIRQVQAPSSQLCSNFAQAILEISGVLIAVLLNAHFPVVAFARPREDGEMQFRFIDAEPLAKVFKGLGCYEVLTSRQANRRLAPEDTLLLGRGEKDQVRYWRPRVIGDIVFNFWD